MTIIPILNIYYLLSYAWDALRAKDVIQVRAEEASDVLDLLSIILARGTTYLLKKGLDRGYIMKEEPLSGLRGKLMLGSSVKRNLLRNGRVICAYDELSHDVLHNQILKATLRSLISTKGIDVEVSKELVHVYRRLPQIRDVAIQTNYFDEIRLNRNNLFYDFLLKICRLIHENLLPDETSGGYKFADFVRDEVRMRALFEAFVRNFFKREAVGFKVYREDIKWHVETDCGDNVFLPRMKTDTCLEDMQGNRKIIIETKFKNEVLSDNRGIKKIHPENLYQLFAYLKNIETKGGANKECEGVLLYASPGQEIDLKFRIPNHFVRVKTLDLSTHWKNIRDQLFSIIA